MSGSTQIRFEFNLPNEVWIDILGYEGIYEVSNLGRIKSLPKVRGRYLFPYSYLLQPKTHRDGYLCVTLQNDKIKSCKMVHRLVAEVFVDNKNNLPQVNHKDGVKINNVPNNLEWCTSIENNRHARITGLNPNLPSPMRKLSMEDAIEIRKLKKEGFTLSKIGEIYGMGFGSIGKIVRNERYVL